MLKMSLSRLSFLSLVFISTGCASTSQNVVDPDSEAACVAADGAGVLLIKCGRFALAVVEVDPALKDESVAKVYRSVVEDAVQSEVLVEKDELQMGSQTFVGFKWETPDRMAPRSGLVLVGDFEGKRTVVTCEVRDAGMTAEARCKERLDVLLREGTENIARVPVEELK